MYVPVIALGALLWLWLMHTRTLPLSGGMLCAHLMLSLWFYALLAVPAWGMVHGQNRYRGGNYHHRPTFVETMLSAEVVLAYWTIGFVVAIVCSGDQNTGPIMYTAGAILLLIVTTPTAWPWLPYYQASFGLYAWDTLLN